MATEISPFSEQELDIGSPNKETACLVLVRVLA